MSTSQIESSSGYDERPFAVVVTERKHELGLSYSVLSARTKAMDRDGRGLSPAYLVRLFNGYEDPVARAICLIAGALGFEPEDFVEYHLHLARAILDERVDRDRAVQSLKLLSDENREQMRTMGGPRQAGRARHAVAR